MTVATHSIGSGRPLFELPGGKFINANKPLELTKPQDQIPSRDERKETENEPARLSQAR